MLNGLSPGRVLGPTSTYTDTFSGRCETSDDKRPNYRVKGVDRGVCKVCPLLCRPVAMALACARGGVVPPSPAPPRMQGANPRGACARRWSRPACRAAARPWQPARVRTAQHPDRVLLPAALAGPCGVPWVRHWATPVLAVAYFSRPPARLPSLRAHAWCRQAKCDWVAECEAYADKPSYRLASAVCYLYGPKMSRSMPGLDGSWSYTKGTATGGNDRVTKGDGYPRFTCHVKDPPPGQRRTAWAARKRVPRARR